MISRPVFPGTIAATLAYFVGSVFFVAACFLGLLAVWVLVGGEILASNGLPPTVTPLPDPDTPPPLPTATSTFFPTPTWTPSPTSTFTPVPSPTPSPRVVIPTQPGLVLPSPTPTPAYPYGPQPGTPTYLSAQTFNKGCNWLGVVGQVLDAQGRPVAAPFFVVVQGQVNGQTFNRIGYAGTAPQLGQVEGQVSGFEVPLSDIPFNSTGLLTIQLFDLNTGLPLSPPVPFDTFADCERNAVLVNFVQQTLP